MFLILRGCEVSKKRKTSGTFNDIGSLELHKKHEVILEEPEDEAIGRARVADQKMIDRLLLDDYIDMNQHRAGEYLLTAAVNAGLFVKTPNLMAVGGGGSKDIYNLCLAIDADFYHQFHGRDDGASNDTTQPHAQQEGMRKTNPVSVRNEIIINPNPDNWGLLDEPIETLSI